MKRLDVSNCMVPSLGAHYLIQGLSCNSFITDVDMSSNNLQSETATKLADMLRKSNTLKRLFLQWNSLGTGGDSFGTFCDGLGANQSLEVLDLRNNQLGPAHVRDLAAALRTNKSLYLRWNSMGPGDGRELLESVQASTKLLCIQLDGNNFNPDLILAIEQAAVHNGDLLQVAQEWQSRCSQLTHHTTELKKREGQRASGVRFLLQHQSQQMSAQLREQENKFKRANAELDVLKTKCKMMESLLKDKDAQIETLQEMNQILRHGKDKEYETLEDHWNDAKEQLETTRNLIHQLRSKLETKDTEISELERTKVELQDRLVLHNTKCTDVVKAAEERALAAVHRAKQERVAVEERLQKDRSHLQAQLETLEQTRLELEAKVVADRISQSEAMAMAREQAVQHEAERVSMLQATIAAMMTEKTALVSKVEFSQAHASHLQEELDHYKHELSKQQKVTENLQEEMLRERSHRQELQSQLITMSERQEDSAKLHSQLASMQDQLNKLNSERETQVRQLTELVSSQEQNLAALRK
ncbi:hypothetical protein B566_EDAN012773 [Ephemera danica]|nr:hypothetical protein B566_EDAN012773 [Ephemera danica]